MRYVSPSVTASSFNCPHCGVLTTQYWHYIYAGPTRRNSLPLVVGPDDTRDFSFSNIEDEEKRQTFVEMIERVKTGLPFLWKTKDTEYDSIYLRNCHASLCYNCSEISIWVADRLIYPVTGEAPPANPDLPDGIKRDYNEASSILNLSPRGSAAIVRLCIQKLCKHLGQPGKNINDDIAALVKAGLDPRVQKALDAVRVIGNNAVHPGEIDLSDDRPTAESLFRMVNAIADKMISEPKHIDDLYGSLPAKALDAIAARDKKENCE
ncbi:DUF4145 domain-containing protein [Rhizobium johnstonii]